MGILLVISFAITAHYIYQNRQRANVESKNKERHNLKYNYEISATHDHDGNCEVVENEQSTYTALKRPGERDDDDHIYTHLTDAQKDYVNQEESRF